jgi:hypothetical protein
MIHYTCDRCKRTINPETEARYVVEIDVRLAGDCDVDEIECEDVDHLAELHHQLQRELNDELSLTLDQPLEEHGAACRGQDFEEGPEQYDLCEHCYAIFATNPLGRETAVGFGFSNN